MTPHPDVASGRYQQAEFAADLWQVHLGEGTDEYRNPVEFFRRTYLTESLKATAGRRRAAPRRPGRRPGRAAPDQLRRRQDALDAGALPPVLRHRARASWPGIDAVLEEAGATKLPTAQRVVLVGNKISPGNPVTKPDGTVVRTLWGELAWQLGGKKAFARVKADDEKATSPGDVLRELFNEYGPCLILIDEWVAYARQLHDQSDLPAGSFETQFTFAQALTESAKLAKNCLLVISLPASDTAGSPHTQADDVEVGGQRGREALDRLRNVVGRVESSWRPASAEEGFEIVRRRLFEPLADPAQFKDRDVVARAFADLYRAQQQEFPPECRDADYEKRIKAAYPIHPEIFDRLYTDWSTLVKFQRTRGVLRLMAAVIHSLWEKGDQNPLILPANISDRRPARAVRADALPLGQLGAGHREGRGRAELAAAADRRRGAEPRQVRRLPARGAHHLPRLGAHRGSRAPRARGPAGQARLRDAGRVAGGLRRCAAAAGRRRRPTSTRTARATGTRRSPRSPSWPRTAPSSSSATPTRWRRSWTSGCAPTCARRATSAASIRCRSRAGRARRPRRAAGRAWRRAPVQQGARQRGRDGGARRSSSRAATRRASIATRWSSSRRTRPACRTSTRRCASYLAWESILAEKETLNLDPHQVQAGRDPEERRRRRGHGAPAGDLPVAAGAGAGDARRRRSTWQAIRLSGQRRAGRAREQEAPERRAAGHRLRRLTRLRMELDRVPLWRGDHVAVKQLVEDFARYLYLPRLAGPDGAGRRRSATGLALLTWEQDTFAYAESYDEAAGRYRGLRGGQQVSIADSDAPGLLVKPEVARRQMDAESAVAPGTGAGTGSAWQKVAVPALPGGGVGDTAYGQGPSASAEAEALPRHGHARPDPRRPRRQPRSPRRSSRTWPASSAQGDGHARDRGRDPFRRVRTTSCAPSPRTAGR